MVSIDSVRFAPITAILMLAINSQMALSQESRPAVQREQLVGGSLVRATVEKMDDSEQVLQVTLILQEVLAGADCDVGEQFKVRVSREGAVALQGLAKFHPQVEKCQSVVWLLERTEGGKLIERYSTGMALRHHPKKWGHALAIRETDQDPRTLSAVALCKTIREVAQVDSSQRWDRLETLCKHDEPLIAGWAMSVLASVDKHAAQPYFQRLVTDEKLPEKNVEMLKDLLERLADE